MKQQRAFIEIELLSEAILGGDGEQKGTVDIDIQVDEHGLPFFSARTLKGVLRDRATWFVRCLPEKKQEKYDKALLQLFGKADDGDEHYANYEALRFGDAKLSQSLYEVIQKENTDFREAMKAITTIRGMTSIDEEKGTAKEASLRQARMIHRGYTFVAPVYINRSLCEIEKELLTTSVKLLRRIGMMRNRGKGEVRCTLYWEENKVEHVTQNVNEVDEYIYLTIDVEEPLKINDVLRTSDSTRALTYIPGHVLRGALVRAYLQDRNLSSSDLDTENLFHPEKIQFWNGYIMIGEKRSLPFAQHIFETKASSKSNEKVRQIYNSLNKEEFQTIEAQSPVRVKGQMMTLDGDTVKATKVETTSSLHMNINGPSGRRDQALLYRYEAIAPNQRFQAVIRTEENHDFVQWLKEKTDFYIWLGGARNSGYGRSRITVRTGNENIEMPKNLGPFSEDLYILATSDWIIYNEQGQLVSSIDEKWLSEQLGATLELVGQVVNTNLTGGYIAQWRAYQPLVRGVKAGSIFRYKIIHGSIDEGKLQQLMNRGVGSRTNEGFGRFIVLANWNYKEIHFVNNQSSLSNIQRRYLRNQERERKEATILRWAIHTERLKDTILEEVNRWYELTGIKTLNQINSSQWSKLLQVANDILHAETNHRSLYKSTWEKFWEDVNKRTDNKMKLGYDKIKISVSENKRLSIKDFILQDLYEKEWAFTKPKSDEAIYWSLEALQLFIRKILRQKQSV